MNDQDKTREQLIAENETLRRRVAQLEATLGRSGNGAGPWKPNDPQWHSLIENTPISIVIIDHDQRIRFTNHTDSGRPLNQALGKHFYDFCRPEHRRTARTCVAQVFRTGRPSSYEAAVLRLDDEEHWYTTYVGPIFTEGKVVAVSVTSFSITERKRAEEALRRAHGELEQKVTERTAELEEVNRQLRSEAAERKRAEELLAQERTFLRTVIDTTPDVILVKDREGRYVLGNVAAARFFGTTVQGLVGRTDYDLLLHHDPAADALVMAEQTTHNETDLRVIESQQPLSALDFTVTDATGQTHWFTAAKVPLIEPDGTCQRMLIAAKDITGRKRAEKALMASEERFELVVRGSGVGIWDWDIRTGKVYYSPRWKRMFGYEEDEIGDSLADWARLLHPDERERIIEFQEDFLAGTASTVTAEYRLRHKDGSYRWIVGHGIVVRDEQGRAVRLVGSHGDITDRKRAEERVEAEQRALGRTVMAGDQERRLITYELHDGVAQQLLGAMMLLESQRPSRGRKPDDTGDAHRLGMDALRRAVGEVRKVMNWLRTPVLDRFGLTDAIADVAAQLRSVSGGPEIEYCHAVEFKRLEPTLENSLFRIAQEAMTNACRHSQSERVRVTLTQEGDEVTLEVRDWGIGFDPDAVQESRFGLEGMRERPRILGGKLSITSQPGQGTTVQVRFAVIEAKDQE